MHISHLTLKNFKRFSNTEIDFSRKITVLLGPNSSGKSSIIKALLALKQTASPTNENEVLAAQGEYVDLGMYKDYVHDHVVGNKIEIAPTISNFPYSITPQGRQQPGSIKFSFTFGQDANTEQARLLNITIADPKDVPLFEIIKKKTRDSFLTKVSSESIGVLGSAIYRGKSDNHAVAFSKWNKGVSTQIGDRYSIYPTPAKESEKHFNDEQIPIWIANNYLSQLLKGLESKFFYLGPLRRSPARSYARTGHLLSVGPAGEFTPSILANLKAKAAKERSHRPPNRERLQQLHTWMEMLFPSKVVDTLTVDELVKLVINRTTTQGETITDVGFGISQVLPILVQIAVMPNDSTLLIEQPELHLHPHAQSKFAEIIVLASKSGRRFIVESHSEHFVRGLQVAVSNERASPRLRNKIERTDVSFIYIPAAPASPFAMELNEWGEFVKEWPKGFFDESYRLTLQLLQNKMKAIEVEQRGER